MFEITEQVDRQSTSDASSKLFADSVPQKPVTAKAPEAPPVWSSSAAFAKDVSNNFSALDLDGNGVINKFELDARAGNSSDKLSRLGSTLLTHFDELNAVLENRTPGITRESIHSLSVLTDPQYCGAYVSASGVLGRTVAGGAVGGGVAAKMNGDSFSSGAGKGAVVGTVVGILAYSHLKHELEEVLNKRNTVDSWPEISHKTCDQGSLPVTDKSTVAPVDDSVARTSHNLAFLKSAVGTIAANHPDKFSESQVLQQFHNLGKNFNAMDANHDGALTFNELVDSIRGNKIPEYQKAVATVIADNFDVISRLQSDKFDGTRITLGDLSSAARIYAPEDSNSRMNRYMNIGTATGIGTAGGLGWGLGIAAVAGATAFAAPAIIGGAIGGLAAYGISRLVFHARDPFADTFGANQAQKLRTELQWLGQ